MTQEDDVILHVPAGLVGSPHLTRFRFFEPTDAYPLKFLCAADEPNVFFVCMDAAAIQMDYAAPLSEEAARVLQLESPEDALVLALVVIPENTREMTANLAGPLVVNIRTRVGVQLVLDITKYPLQHPVFTDKDESILHFPAGLVGFTDLRHFRLFEPQDSYPLKFLQSVEKGDCSFVCADAGAIKMDYQVQLRPEDAAFLALEKPEDALILALVVVPEDPRSMTANLAGPLVINTRTRKGRQVVLNTDDYPLRFPILGER